MKCKTNRTASYLLLWTEKRRRDGLMHEPGFPVLKIGNRMVVPKEKFIQWVEQNTAGGTRL